MRKQGQKESYNRRERFSMFQLNVLCRVFEETPNPSMNVRNAIATRLNIPLDRVNVWFQNQRARGFPARRILQQQQGAWFPESQASFDLEASKILSACDSYPPHTPKHSVGESKQSSPSTPKESPVTVPPNMADFLLQIPLSYKNGSPTESPTISAEKTMFNYDISGFVKSEPRSQSSPVNAHGSVKTRSPQTLSSPSSYGMKTPILKTPKVEPSYNYTISPIEQPLDLSTGNLKVKEERQSPDHSSHGSSPSVSAATHIPVPATNGATKGLTGASKRKRGSKPQQIINRNTFIETELHGESFNCSPKRRRMSDESQEGKDREYEYVLTPDDNLPTSPDIADSINAGTTGISRLLTRRENSRSRSCTPDNDKENVCGAETGADAEKEALLTAVCASLAMKGTTSDRNPDTNVVEPDLD